MHSSTASLTAFLLCVLAMCAAVQSLGGRVFQPTGEHKDDKFVTDPSANVPGIFKKEGDMTFIMHSDPLSDDFEFEDDDEEEGTEDSTGGRKKRNAIRIASALWPSGIVPYEISSYFNDEERRVILSAMRHWENKTCIRFRPKNSNDAYYIVFMSGPVGVCQSFVGRMHIRYQPQGITLGQYCVHFSTVVHEIGHAVGFYHEHNRPDRDEHIEVRYKNVLSGLQRAFDKVEPGTTNLLGYGYDYASIMHYSRDAFSSNNLDTIVAKDPKIPFGDAEELSPLDIAKTRALYSCGAESTWPAISTVVPADILSLPSDITCGQVSDGKKSGTYTSPGFPNHRHNLDCAYVVRVPKGYYVQLKLNNFDIEQSSTCSKDYVQIYYGTELTSNNVARFSGTTEGRICDNRGYTLTYSIFTDVVTLFYHTDGSGSGRRGLSVTFTAIDENECQFDGSKCHECNNLDGGFECVCRDGYYHSAAAATCYDVNECAYDNGGCQHKCINSGGSYRCECNSGYYLQADGKSCASTPSISTCGRNFTASTGTFQTPNWPSTYPTNIDCEWFIQLPNNNKVVEITCGDDPYGIAGAYPGCTKDYITVYDGHSAQSTAHGPYCEFTKPGTVKMSSNLAKVHFYAGPSHSPSRVGVKCSFRSVDAPTPPPPTTPPPPPPTTPPPAQCGGLLTTSSGTFQTPNWPETYPNNIDCEWRIQLPDSKMLVEIRCEEDPFGIAGALPACDKDYLKFYDGHSKQDTAHGPFCHYTKPEATKMSSNKAMAVFHSGPSHSSSRRGFKCSFQSVAASTTSPPPPPTTPTTTPPPTTTMVPTVSSSVCGGTISAASGTFQTPNWPETYPNNIDCEWRIQLPDESKLVEIRCEEDPFGIAGALPACDKDYLKFYDGHSKQDTAHGPFCYFTKPEATKMSSNKAMAVFHSGPSHSSSRKGFKCSFRSVDAPAASECGGTFTAASGSFKSPNWPQTYPVNIDCTWTIILSDSSKRVEIDFDSPFGIAGGLPTCSHTDKLYVHDDNTGTQYGPYCYFTVPNPPVMTSNRARVVLHAGPSHSPSRVGFRATYRSV